MFYKLDILNLAASERVRDLISQYQGQSDDDTDDKLLSQVNSVIDKLPQEEQHIMSEFFTVIYCGSNHLENHLYKKGVSDGIKIMKYIQKI